MFEINKEELQNWRSQIGTSNEDKMGLRYIAFLLDRLGVEFLIQIKSRIKTRTERSRSGIIDFEFLIAMGVVS